MLVREHHVSDVGLMLLVTPTVTNLQLRRQGDQHGVPLEYRDHGDGWIELPTAQLADFSSDETSRYDVLGESAGQPGAQHVLSFGAAAAMPIWRRYFGQPGESVQFYVNRKGFLSVVSRDPIQADLTEKHFRAEHSITRLRLLKRQVRVSLELRIMEPGEFEVRELVFARANGRHIERTHTAAHECVASADGLRVTGRFQFDADTPLTSFRYAMLIVLREKATGAEITLRVDRLGEALYNRLYDGIVAPRGDLNSNQVLALATNPRTTSVGFIVQPKGVPDKQPLRQKAYAATARGVAYVKRRAKAQPRPVALIFEKRATSAQDNGFALFLYLLQSRRQGATIPFDFYFVIDEASPQASRVRALPNVLAKHSLEVWKLIAMPGTFTVSSDARFHLADQYAQPDLLNKYLYMRKNYFLQHGVLGLKKVGLLSPGHAMQPDFLAVSSAWEQEAAVNAGFAEGAIDLVGLPRWDRLHQRRAARRPGGCRSILFMPTWRPWLEGASAETVFRSDYVQSIRELLESEELAALLEERDARVLFLPHPLMKDALRRMSLDSERIQLVNEDEVELADVLAEADLVVTDYSSIIWDFIQMGRLGLLFQFDKRQYDKEVGSYTTAGVVAALKELPQATSTDGLLEALSGLLALPAEAHDVFGSELREKLFPAADANNAERVFQALVKRLPNLVKTKPRPAFSEADARYRKRVAAAVAANQSTAAHNSTAPAVELAADRTDGFLPGAVKRERTRATVARMLEDEGIPYFWVPHETGSDGAFAVEAADWPGLIWAVKTKSADTGLSLVSRSGATGAGLGVGAFDAATLGLVLESDTGGARLPAQSARIEKWTRSRTGELRSQVRNTRASALDVSVQAPAQVALGDYAARSLEVLTQRSVFQITEPIDLVYLWVDGSDPHWAKKHRETVEALTGEILPDSDNVSRFRDNGELKYAMRSAFEYCSWARKIILVTDGQVPDWLDTDHPKIQIVDHTELFGDEGQLPTFNSHAIGARLHHIEGLSERYLLVNDDVFFGKEVHPETFFLANGMTKFFLSKSTVPIGDPESPAHELARRNVAELLEAEHGVMPARNFFHTPVPQSRKLLFSLEARFPEAFRQTSCHQLRSSEDYEINGWMHHYFGYMEKQAIPGSIVYDYFSTDDEALETRLEALAAKRNASAFCINDAPNADQYKLAYLGAWLARYFPVAAPWERDPGNGLEALRVGEPEDLAGELRRRDPKESAVASLDGAYAFE